MPPTPDLGNFWLWEKFLELTITSIKFPFNLLSAWCEVISSQKKNISRNYIDYLVSNNSI